MKQTAVKWLLEYCDRENWSIPNNIIEQAEQMDFENIKHAYNDGKRDAYRQDDVPTADEYVYQKYGQ
jgi:hypothetical protein